MLRGRKNEQACIEMSRVVSVWKKVKLCLSLSLHMIREVWHAKILTSEDLTSVCLCVQVRAHVLIKYFDVTEFAGPRKLCENDWRNCRCSVKNPQGFGCELKCSPDYWQVNQF